MRISDWSSDVCSSDLNNRSRRWNRRGSPVGSHGIKIARPSELTPKLPNLVLFAKPKQRPQAELNGLTLCLEARCPESFAHKIIVDDDVGPHDVYPFLRSYTYEPLKAFAIHHGVLPTLKHGTRR